MKPMAFRNKSLSVESGDGHNVTLLEPLIYVRPDGTLITVPIGATSDGISTPPAIWPELPPFGPWWFPGILHDHLYRDTFLPKDFCDDVFKEAMLSNGVSERDAETIYLGVKFGGWKAFRDDRTRE